MDLLFRPKEVTLGGKTYFGQGRDTGALAVHFADERTMIVGEERVVRKMLGKEKGLSALTEALDDLDLDADIVGVLNVAAVREQVMPRTETDPASKAIGRRCQRGHVFRAARSAAFGQGRGPREGRGGRRPGEGDAPQRESPLPASSLRPCRRDTASRRSGSSRELARDLFTRGVNALQVRSRGGSRGDYAW